MHDTLGQLEGKALMRTRSHALAQPKAETTGDTLSDLEVEALLNTLAKTLSRGEGEDT